MEHEVNEGGLWCHEVLAALDDWVDGRLTQQVEESVHDHVRGCERCAAFGSRYASLVEAMRRGRAATWQRPPSQGLLARLKQLPKQVEEG